MLTRVTHPSRPASSPLRAPGAPANPAPRSLSRHCESAADILGQTTELWTIRRAARYLSISTKRVYQLISSGKFQSVKLGARSTRITRQSVEAFVLEGVERARAERGLDLQRKHTPTGRKRTS